MNKLQIDNLKEIIDAKYPHIYINHFDLIQFLNIPWEAKRFYPCKGYDKRGFFHNGQTTVWANLSIERNMIKIADKEIPRNTNSTANWSNAFSFEKENAPVAIQKMMKLKAFW